MLGLSPQVQASAAKDNKKVSQSTMVRHASMPADVTARNTGLNLSAVERARTEPTHRVVTGSTVV
jgi:hypothetical protein